MIILKSQRVKISTETVLNYLGYGLKVFLLDLVKAEDPITKDILKSIINIMFEVYELETHWFDLIFEEIFEIY
ncbi:MAG: hypothetical protein Q9M97_00605 [Candidatus Gracilibacteria bacterium]|nr:hypothetical protein [Candidatus Gracilibacteria bacterium]